MAVRRDTRRGNAGGNFAQERTIGVSFMRVPMVHDLAEIAPAPPLLDKEDVMDEQTDLQKAEALRDAQLKATRLKAKRDGRALKQFANALEQMDEPMRLASITWAADKFLGKRWR